MKIDDRVSNYMSLLLGDSLKPAPKTKDTVEQPQVLGATEDNVTISPTAAHMGEDEAHHERLLAIRRQLSEGTYNISGKDVAKKMLDVLKG